MGFHAKVRLLQTGLLALYVGGLVGLVLALGQVPL